MRSRLSLLLIAAAAAVVLAVAPTAAAQVAVSGTFLGPHGAVSFNTGVPFGVPVAHHGWNRGSYGYSGRGYTGRGYYGHSYYRPHYYQRHYYRPYVRRYYRPYYGGGYGYYGYAPNTVIVQPGYDYDDDCD